MPSPLAEQLQAESGLSVTVSAVEDYARARTMLCDYNDDDRFVAAWLDGPAMALAVAQGCGEVILQSTRSGKPWVATEVMVKGGGALSSVQGEVFCRRDVSDSYSWLVPSLALQANDLQPDAFWGRKKPD